jgi:hypothetical protein
MGVLDPRNPQVGPKAATFKTTVVAFSDSVFRRTNPRTSYSQLENQDQINPRELELQIHKRSRRDLRSRHQRACGPFERGTVPPTLWLEATEMDARFCMERLWYIEGVRVLTPNLRCAHRQRFQVCAHAHSLTLADSPCLGVAHSPQHVWIPPRPGVVSTPEGRFSWSKRFPGRHRSFARRPSTRVTLVFVRRCDPLANQVALTVRPRKAHCHLSTNEVLAVTTSLTNALELLNRDA